MPKLQIYERNVQPQQQGINTNVSAAFEGQADVGRNLQQMGSQIAGMSTQQGFAEAEANAGEWDKVTALGNEYMNKANGAIEDAQFNDKFSKASLMYNQRVTQRMQQQVDDQGRPAWQTMQTDIDKISDEVYQEFTKDIYNTNVSARFNESFNQLKLNKSLQAQQVARTQQLEFSTAALQQGLNADMVNAMQDTPQMVEFYYQQGLGKINQALANGYLDPVEAERQKESLRKQMYMGSIEVMNSRDPYAVQQMLKEGNSFGLTPLELLKVEEANQRTIRDLEVQKAQEAQHRHQVILSAQTLNKDKLETLMTEGQVGEQDLAVALEKGNINDTQYWNLRQKLAGSLEKNIKTQQTRSAIIERANNGELLSGFSNADINDSYLSQIGHIPNASISAKAQVAAMYKAPVTEFTGELKAISLSGTSQQVGDAVKAYMYARDKSPATVSAMDDKTRAFMSSLAMQQRYTGMDMDQAILQARKQILDADDNIVKMRSQNFSREKAFQDTNVRQTIADMYDARFFSMFGSDTPVDDNLVPVVQDLLKSAYSFTGDVDKAQALVKDQTKGLIGVSSINKSSNVMYAPPEQSYQDFTADELRQDLQGAVSSYLPADVLPEDVEVSSDQRTVFESNSPSYPLIYRNADGVAFPLLDTTGQPLRWKPDVNKQKEKRLNEINAMRQERFSLEQFGAKYGTSEGINVLGLKQFEGKPKDSKFTPSVEKVKEDFKLAQDSGALRQDKVDVDSLLVNPTRELAQTQVSSIMEKIAGVESGGNYTAIGPRLSDGRQALGKYQVLNTNLPSWSLEAVGRYVTPQEFLQSPALQDQIARHKMSQYYEKYGNASDVASVWHSGVPVSKAGERVDQGTGLSTLSYVKRVTGRK